MKEALFYEKMGEGKVRCRLCFHECALKEGQLGFCLARRNVNGKLIAETYGQLVAAHTDPIEKKPLYHFDPGKDVLSVAGNGCNLACPFCQNAEISQQRTNSEFCSPEDLVKLAKRYRSPGIAYTYTEPLVWFEYTLDASKIAHEAGLYNVLVTNGIINEEPLRELLPHVDAANVDLKGNDAFYRKVLKGDRESVIRTIRMMHEAGIHVELTTLLIPGGNDSEAEVDEVISFIEGLDSNIPLHLSRYFPHHGYSAPATPVDTMLRAYEQAKTRLPYVYLGNVLLSKGQNTLCPACGATLIERLGYRTQITGIKDKRCASCGREVDIVL